MWDATFSHCGDLRLLFAWWRPSLSAVRLVVETTSPPLPWLRVVETKVPGGGDHLSTSPLVESGGGLPVMVCAW